MSLEGREERIIINPLSKSIDIVNGRGNELLRLLSSKGLISRTSKANLRYLLERGYIFNSAKDEEYLFRRVLKKDEKEETPYDFLLYPTFRCNFRCTYCFQRNGARTPKIITKEYTDKAFDAMDIIDRKFESRLRPLLYLFGGEPLLKEKQVKETIQHALSKAYNKNYRLGIVTNGSNLCSYADTLEKHKVEFIQVTLDGPKKIHNSRRLYANGQETFDDIVEGIDSLINSDIRMQIRVNLDSQNISSIPEFAELALESEWNKNNVEFFAGPYRDLSYGNYEYQQRESVMLEMMLHFYETNPPTRIVKLRGWPGVDLAFYILKTRNLPPPRVRYCIANYGRYGFDPEGYVYACGNAAGIKEYSIGEYYPKLRLHKSKSDVWRKRRCVDNSQCARCRMALLCGGGCTFQSLLKHKGEKPFCPELQQNLSVILSHYSSELLGERSAS